MIPLTRNQIQKIHVLKSRLGWDDEAYRAALAGWTKYPQQCGLTFCSCHHRDDACKYGCDHERLECAQKNLMRARSCKDLDCAAATELIKRMEALLPAGPQSPAMPPQSRNGRLKYEELGHRPGMASPGQLRKIEAIWARVSRQPDQASRDKALKQFVETKVAVSAMEWLEPRHIQILVAALEAMERQEIKKRKAE